MIFIGELSDLFLNLPEKEPETLYGEWLGSNTEEGCGKLQ
jgi:hypothetical protein